MKKRPHSRHLTKSEFKNMSWEKIWERAIPIDRDEFIRKHKKGKA